MQRYCCIRGAIKFNYRCARVSDARRLAQAQVRVNVRWARVRVTYTVALWQQVDMPLDIRPVGKNMMANDL